MNISKFIKSNYAILAALVLLLFITYWRVPFLFFQQDEWLVFGLLIDKGVGVITRGLGSDRTFHFVPVDWLINVGMFNIFRLNNVAYNVAGLLLHLLNSYLVCLLGFRYFKNRKAALLAGIFFLSSSVAAQLVMWTVASLNTLSLTFTLLAWLLLTTSSKYKELVLGLVVSILSLLSLFSIEYSIGLFIFIPAAFLLHGRKTLTTTIKFLLPLFIIFVVYMTIRAFSLAANIPVKPGSTMLTPTTILFKVSRLPLRYMGQLFLSENSIIGTIRLLNNNLPCPLVEGIKESKMPFISSLLIDGSLTETNCKWAIDETQAFTKITFVAGALIVLLFLFIFKKAKKISISYSYSLLIFFIFVLTSALPFIFIPGEAGNFLIIPPRYLYTGLAGFSLILAFLVDIIYLNSNTSLKKIAMVCALLIVMVGIYQNWATADVLLARSRERQQILNTITRNYPNLGKNSVFYTESNSSFYGLPKEELILPFQSGFGQTLLVWYHANEKFPHEFFRNRFLWEITDQGYQQVESRGFGYFRDFENLAKEVTEKNLQPDDIKAFEYDSTNQTFNEISEEVRGRVSGFKAAKKQINPRSVVATSSHNLNNAYLITDGDGHTFWDSKTPYIFPQYIELDLLSNKKIAQITINSGDDLNQDEVGYEVLVSDDKKIWRKVFHASKYPPKENGLVNLYINPEPARYIRINQIGHHRYASWVIHEMIIFESINE